MEAKHIAKNIKLDDQIESLAKKPTFITLKGHKENFRSATIHKIFETNSSFHAK